MVGASTGKWLYLVADSTVDFANWEEATDQ